MVLFFTSNAVNPPATIYMGRDKYENEDLIKYGFEEDVWFHVDKLSSAHVYLRMPSGMTWDNIPEALLTDLAQLVKANSIEGNKKNNLTIIYTPWSNLKKDGSMAVGQVTFHSDKKVKRVYVASRENAIVNRLNKTKVEKEVDHETIRLEREKERNKKKQAKANEQKKAELELARQRAAEKEARSYDNLFTEETMAKSKNRPSAEDEEDEGAESDVSFM